MRQQRQRDREIEQEQEDALTTLGMSRKRYRWDDEDVAELREKDEAAITEALNWSFE